MWSIGTWTAAIGGGADDNVSGCCVGCGAGCGGAWQILSTYCVCMCSSQLGVFCTSISVLSMVLWCKMLCFQLCTLTSDCVAFGVDALVYYLW